MPKLRISESLALPVDAVTNTFALLAKRGAGKSYTASVMAEEMLEAKQHIVALDPTGVWYGLRSVYPVVILGGDHGDLPLDEHAGELIASAIVENRFPAILDLSHFRKGQMIRFMVQFAETLYRLNRDPLHLFMDEADIFAPQGRNFGGDENRMLGAIEDIVRRGRKRGIGCTLITQRPAVLNKSVLTQCESLFALRLVHPRDIGAVMEWINVHADPKDAEAVVKSLPTLPVGEAWFWSPGWLGRLERVRIRRRRSFDSGATPKPGEHVKPPKTLAKVDIEALGEKMKAMSAKAKADDPRELRRQIESLRAQLAKVPAAKVETRKVEVPVIQDAQIKRLENVAFLFGKAAETARSIANTLEGAAWAAKNAANKQKAPAPSAPSERSVHKLSARLAPADSNEDRRDRKTVPFGADGLGAGERKILSAVAQYENGVTRDQLTVLTGYKRSSRDTYIHRLRQAGFVQQEPFDSNTISVTASGLEVLGPYFERLPTGRALLEYWLARLPEGERKILTVLVERHPDSVRRSDLDEATGYKRSSRDTYLQRLRSRKLIHITDGGEVLAAGELFP